MYNKMFFYVSIRVPKKTLSDRLRLEKMQMLKNSINVNYVWFMKLKQTSYKIKYLHFYQNKF